MFEVHFTQPIVVLLDRDVDASGRGTKLEIELRTNGLRVACNATGVAFNQINLTRGLPPLQGKEAPASSNHKQEQNHPPPMTKFRHIAHIAPSDIVRSPRKTSMRR
jgi:hypothetical protein